MRDPKPVRVWLQVILGFIPIAWIGALYNIQKLRLGLAIFIPLSIGLGFLFPWLGFPPYTSLAISMVIWAILIWKWSVDWNKRFSKPTV